MHDSWLMTHTMHVSPCFSWLFFHKSGNFLYNGGFSCSERLQTKSRMFQFVKQALLHRRPSIGGNLLLKENQANLVFVASKGLLRSFLDTLKQLSFLTSYCDTTYWLRNNRFTGRKKGRPYMTTKARPPDWSTKSVCKVVGTLQLTTIKMTVHFQSQFWGTLSIPSPLLF